jgi:hypothetical protein
VGVVTHRTLVNGKLKKIPTFGGEDEEREFWSHADSTEYIDWSKAKERSFAQLRPTPRTISGAPEKRRPGSR